MWLPVRGSAECPKIGPWGLWIVAQLFLKHEQQQGNHAHGKAQVLHTLAGGPHMDPAQETDCSEATELTV